MYTLIGMAATEPLTHVRTVCTGTYHDTCMPVPACFPNITHLRVDHSFVFGAQAVRRLATLRYLEHLNVDFEPPGDANDDRFEAW